MAVRLLVLFLTPDLPSWIRTARETLEFREQTVYQTYEALEQVKQYREKYEQKLSSHMDDMKEHLEAALHEESLSAIFERIDVDGSGALLLSVDWPYGEQLLSAPSDNVPRMCPSLRPRLTDWPVVYRLSECRGVGCVLWTAGRVPHTV